VTNRSVWSALLILLFAIPVFAEPDSQQTTFCTFDDGNEISIRYQGQDATKKNDPPQGKPWGPNASPIFLFTTTDITLGNTSIPTGAYSLYLVKGRSDWSLIVNKNVTQGSPYDDKQDLARVNMDTNKLPSSGKPFNITLGHIAPKVCSIQVVYGDSAGWVEFKQKQM